MSFDIPTIVIFCPYAGAAPIFLVKVAGFTRVKRRCTSCEYLFKTKTALVIRAVGRDIRLTIP